MTRYLTLFLRRLPGNLCAVRLHGGYLAGRWAEGQFPALAARHRRPRVFIPAKEAGVARPPWHRPAESVIVHVSRLVREKRTDILAQTLRQLSAMGVAHKALIVGDGPERAR